MPKFWKGDPQIAMPLEPPPTDGGLVCKITNRATAVRACWDWHYRHDITQSEFMYGFWRGELFDGIIAFRRHQIAHLIKHWDVAFGGYSVELVRIALRDQGERSDPTTKYIKMAIQALRRDNDYTIEGIYSYSDCLQGHTGGIYQAANFLYLGEHVSREWVNEQGDVISGRAVGGYNGIAMETVKNRGYRQTPTKKRRWAFPITRNARKLITPKVVILENKALE